LGGRDRARRRERETSAGIEQGLRPFAVVMARADVFDPFKD